MLFILDVFKELSLICVVMSSACGHRLLVESSRRFPFTRQSMVPLNIQTTLLERWHQRQEGRE
jgi:hypothetical protein